MWHLDLLQRCGVKLGVWRAVRLPSEWGLDGTWKTRGCCSELQGGTWFGTTGLSWRLLLSICSGYRASTSVCRSQTQAMQTRWGLLLPWGGTSSFFPATSSHRSRNLHYPGRCLLPLILWKEQAGLPHFGARKYFFFPVTTETLIEFCLETFLQLFLSKCNYWSWWEFQCWLN